MDYLYHHIFRLALILSLATIPITGIEPPAERPVIKVLTADSEDIARIGFYYGHRTPYRYYGRPYGHYGYRRQHRYYQRRSYGNYRYRSYGNYGHRPYRYHRGYRHGGPRYRSYRSW